VSLDYLGKLSRRVLCTSNITAFHAANQSTLLLTTNQHVERDIRQKEKKQREKGEEKGEKRRRKGGVDNASYSFVVVD